MIHINNYDMHAVHELVYKPYALVDNSAWQSITNE